MEQESKGPAEVILQSLLSHTDHLYHNRPGMVKQDGRTRIGVSWSPVTHKEENGQKIVYALSKSGRRVTRTRVGVLGEDGSITEGRSVVAQYRPAGIFPEVAHWMYNQVAELWRMDNEFAARWASYAFGQEHRDLKVILAAFLLCQSRKGDPEVENGEVLFYDEDYRDVGEAMLLLRSERRDFNPKMLLRVREVLIQDGVAEVNRQLGFGRSNRNPFLGRWPKAVAKWLRFREQNPPVLQGLVKAGFRKSVIRLSQIIGYKPEGENFFQILRWKQKQAPDGRREVALGVQIQKQDSWDDLTEEQICQKIVSEKPSYKVITSRVPVSVGVTRAVMAAAIESGCLSDKDLVIATPTLETLGLLEVQDIKERWSSAVRAAEDQRSRNIARNVKGREVVEVLKEGADAALQKKVEEVSRNMRIYFFVDISGSMQQSLDEAKACLENFVQAFPLDRVHVCVFNTVAREIKIQHASAAGVRAAFRGYGAGGGTDYATGVRLLSKYPPSADEDALFIFVGDEGAANFPRAVQQSGLNPVAFGLLKVGSSWRHCVTETAASLEIPCFEVEQSVFSDPYQVPRTLHNLIASTPVGVSSQGARTPRVMLVDQILQTDLLKKPAWAITAS